MVSADQPIEGLTPARGVLDEALQCNADGGRIARALLGLCLKTYVALGLASQAEWRDAVVAWSLTLTDDRAEAKALREAWRTSLQVVSDTVAGWTSQEGDTLSAWRAESGQKGVALWWALHEFMQGQEDEDSDLIESAMRVCDAYEQLLTVVSNTARVLGVPDGPEVREAARRTELGTLFTLLPSAHGDIDWVALAHERRAVHVTSDADIAATIEGITEVREAWETLVARGVIAVAWEEGRRFRGTVQTAWGARKMTALPLPAIVQDVALVAQHQRRIERAEPFALAFAHAIAPWEPGRARGERVEWCFPTQQSMQERSFAPWPVALESQLRDALERAKPLCERERITELAQWIGDLRVEHGTTAAHYAEIWRAVAGVRAKVRAQAKVPEALEGVLFAALSNPFAPLVQLAQLGVSVVDNRDGVIVLRLEA